MDRPESIINIPMMHVKLPGIIRFLAMTVGVVVWAWLFGYVIFLMGVTFVQPQLPNEKTDAIVVLTGGQNRIHTGLALLELGQAEHLFISGVNPDVTIEQLVRIWKPDIEAIPCCIALGYAASNTEGNARESSQWVRDMDLTSIRLVTSNYHLPRAWLEFRHALPRRTIISHPIRSATLADGSWEHMKLSFAEYNKTLLTWVRLYVYPWDRIVKVSQW